MSKLKIDMSGDIGKMTSAITNVQLATLSAIIKRLKIDDEITYSMMERNINDSSQEAKDIMQGLISALREYNS